MTRIQDKSKEAYQSEPKFASSQKLQLDMLTIPHNKSSTVWVAISRWTGQWLTRFPYSWDFCLTWWIVVNPPRRFLGVISAIYIGTWLLSGTQLILLFTWKIIHWNCNLTTYHIGKESHPTTYQQSPKVKPPSTLSTSTKHLTLWSEAKITYLLTTNYLKHSCFWSCMII